MLFYQKISKKIEQKGERCKSNIKFSLSLRTCCCEKEMFWKEGGTGSTIIARTGLK